MSASADTCLQCGKSREQVKDYYDSPCATATYGETVEGLDDWDRHHWRDWSNKSLLAAGILPEHFEDHRRDDVYSLPYAPCEHTKWGHRYPEQDEPDFGFTTDRCVHCGETKGTADD